METNKEFAEKHAGEYFMFGKVKVQVVGYCSDNITNVLVSIPDNVHTFGWSRDVLASRDVFTFLSTANEFWYAGIEHLKQQMI